MYKLQFHALVLKEWHKLDDVIRKQFEAKLKERLQNSCVSISSADTRKS